MKTTHINFGLDIFNIKGARDKIRISQKLDLWSLCSECQTKNSFGTSLENSPSNAV